jgi:predicted PurR-regulated permease PerM
LLFAAALHAPARWLEERGLPRGVAASIPYLALAGIILVLIVVIVPPLAEEATTLIENLPAMTDAALGAVVGVVDRLLGGGAGERVVDQLTAELEGFRPDVGPLLMLPLTLFETLVAIGTTLFLSFLLIVERQSAERWFLRFVDSGSEDVVVGLGRNVLDKLGAYVRGQLLVMTVIGVGSTVGMLVIGVPFALPLGLFAFLTEAIPLVGPFIAAVPIVTIAFLQDVPTGLLMLGWILVLQQAESWALTPIIQGKVLSLSPIAVLLAVFAGAQLAGIVGAVIAVPAVAALDVLLREVVIPLRQNRRIGAQASGEDDGEGGSPRVPQEGGDEGDATPRGSAQLERADSSEDGQRSRRRSDEQQGRAGPR